MSSDWISLFVHQGKEFIESVSRKGRDDESEVASASISSSSMANKDEQTLSEIDEIDIKEEDVCTTRSRKAESETERSCEKASTSSSKEPVTGAEKYIYETQLEQLQEQLVDIMIQNQEMATELASFRNSDISKLSKELDKEQSKRRQLEERLKKTRNEDGTPKLRRRRRKECSNSASNEPENELGNEPFDAQEINDKPKQAEFDDLTSEESDVTRFKWMKLWIYSWYISLSQRVTLTIYDIVSDLTDEETVLDSEDVETPLAVKTLKENIKRFRNGIKPISECFKKSSWVLSWQNPAATMLIFLVYVFSFWHGYTISLVIFLAIVQLSSNFIYNKFGSVSSKDDTESPMEHSASWSDRFQIVLHVARQVQNILGLLSDYLEKIKNLLMWKVSYVTLKLYLGLWMLLIASLALNGPQFFTLLGMFLGFKLFILSPLYKRFPKLRKRYDTTLRLWNELPVDSHPSADGQNNESEEGQTLQSTPQSEISTLSSQLFCARYKLTTDEILVKGWEEGWRTSLMNKNKPLVNIKHGRLYLTQSYLCFERSRTNVDKNTLLKLSDIRCVNKYKPLFIMPGTGMAIEVCMKDKDEPYIFAAIVGRDDAYNDIIRTAKEAGLSWAK